MPNRIIVGCTDVELYVIVTFYPFYALSHIVVHILRTQEICFPDSREKVEKARIVPNNLEIKGEFGGATEK